MLWVYLTLHLSWFASSTINSWSVVWSRLQWHPCSRSGLTTFWRWFPLTFKRVQSSGRLLTPSLKRLTRTLEPAWKNPWVRKLLEWINSGWICDITISCLLSVQLALVKPEVSGLEDDDAGPPPEEEAGLDYSSPWHETFLANRHEIGINLHTLHPSMQTVLKMCQATLGEMLMVDCSGFR